MKIREKIKELKKENAPAPTEIATLSEKAIALEREARELEGKAQSIEDAVYDLKAVNPHAKTVEDTRTPEELLDLIESKGREVAKALKTLRSTFP